MLNWVGRTVMASTRTAGKMNRMAHWEAGSQTQSKSRSLFTNELCTQGKKNSMQASFTIISWYLWSGRRLFSPPSTSISILNPTNSFGNKRMILNQSEFMVSSICQRHSSRLIMISKILLKNQGVSFQNLYLVWCLPPMGCNWYLSVLPSCGLFILW